MASLCPGLAGLQLGPALTRSSAVKCGRKQCYNVQNTSASAAVTNLQQDEQLKRWKSVFVEHSGGRHVVAGSTGGPLSGLHFAAKDMFDVAGVPTGFGNPTWLETHEMPKETATALQELLKAGATLVGKTQMDELAFSLAGENVHYGTPPNPAAPGRISGGSSSGSAAAVASGLVDFAIGSDTAGSIRVPASHCGILGMRPTHGRISLEGARPLQPSLDTVGWFALDPGIFRRVGHVLLQSPLTKGRRRLTRWLVAKDAFDLAEREAVEAIYQSMTAQFGKVVERLGKPEEVVVASGAELGSLKDWMQAAKTIQLAEAWASHGEWIRRVQPKLGPAVRERFEAAAKVTPGDLAAAQATRQRFSELMQRLVVDGVVLAVPSAPGIAPLCGTAPKELESFRERTLCLSVIAGPAGLPQVNLPIASVQGCPIGLGLIAPRGWDEELLELAEELMAIFAGPFSKIS